MMASLKVDWHINILSHYLSKWFLQFKGQSMPSFAPEVELEALRENRPQKSFSQIITGC